MRRNARGEKCVVTGCGTLRTRIAYLTLKKDVLMDTNSQHSMGNEVPAAKQPECGTTLPAALMSSGSPDVRVRRTDASLKIAPELQYAVGALYEEVSEFRGYIVDVTEQLEREAWHFSLWLTRNDNVHFPIEESGYGHKGKFLTTQAMWNHLRMFCRQDNTLYRKIEQELQSERRAYLPPLYLAHLLAYELGWKQP